MSKVPADVILKTASAFGLAPLAPSVASAVSLMHSVQVVSTFVTPAGGAHETDPASSSIWVRARQYTNVSSARLSVRPVGKLSASPGAVPQPTVAFVSRVA